MKKLMAIVLGIALLSPTPANANTDNEIKDTFLKIISGNDIELQPLTGHPGWISNSQGSGWYLEDYTKISLGVSVCRSGIPVWLLECAMNAKTLTFSIVDATGRHVHFSNVSHNSWKNGLEILSVKNVNIELSPVPRLVMPLSLKAEFEFHPTSSQTMKTFYYPLNVRFNKIDIAKQEAEAKAIAEAKAKAEAELKAKQEAEAKAIAEAKAKQEAELKAKQEAEAKAKAEAEAKAKAEAEAKAKAEAKTWTCRQDLQDYYLNTYNMTIALMNEAESNIFCNKLLAEINAKAQAEVRANAEALLKPFVGKSCKTLGNYKVISVGSLQCIKVKNKKVWGKLKLN